jgi:hypothetical protein
MNRSDFLNMIENTVPVNRQMIGDVYELINLFPYFQSAHMLLLKALQESSDVKFEIQLRTSSVHIADREVLYYFLNRKQEEETGKKAPESETDPVRNDDFNDQQTVIESARNSDELINKIEEDSAEKVQEDDGYNNLIQYGHSILITSEAGDEEKEGIIQLSEYESDQDEEKIFYMDPGIPVPESPDLLELDLNAISDYSPEMEPGPVEKVHPEKLLQSELIDKFILENPRIEPKRDKMNIDQEDISKPFVEESDGFVTETLARIYVSQGYYSKAIDIYEKLSLKFPEKSSYFATQIEKVKEFIKK